jgi:CrcB protein
MAMALVAACGAAGSVARFAVTVAMRQWLGDGFPFGTFAVNLLGCFGFGLCWSLFGSTGSPAVRAAVFAGFFGGFTTFSSFAFEACDLLQAERLGAAALHVLGQNALGIAGAWLGIALGRAWS